MSTGIKSEEKTTGTQYSACLTVSPSLSGSVAMAGACPPAAGGKVPPGRPRQADVTMVPGIWQELSASIGYGWSWTEHQLEQQSKQAAWCHNTSSEGGYNPSLSSSPSLSHGHSGLVRSSVTLANSTRCHKPSLAHRENWKCTAMEEGEQKERRAQGQGLEIHIKVYLFSLSIFPLLDFSTR